MVAKASTKGAKASPQDAGEPNVDSLGKPSFYVKVYAPFQIYFEGDAYSLSAENATGPFDILPKHHNFLCMLVPCNLKINPVNGDSISVKIYRALMHVKADQVTVFMDV